VATTLPAEGIPTVKFLTSAGGSMQITTNNATVGVDYFYEPPPGYGFIVHSLCVQVADNANFNQTDYGAISGGLTVGLSFWLNSKGVDVPLLASQVIKRNLDWARISPNVTLTSWAGLSQTLIVNLDTDARFGLPLTLSSANNERIILRTRDDFTSLVDHTFALGGVLFPLSML
jgi:hypothetical protein